MRYRINRRRSAVEILPLVAEVVRLRPGKPISDEIGYGKVSSAACLKIVLSVLVLSGGWMTTLDVSVLTANDEPVAVDGKILSLKQKLEKDLRARRPQEFAFIKKVVDRVDDKTLPLSVVDSTYLWARKKPLHPFQYFERAMKIRAKKFGVNL